MAKKPKTRGRTSDRDYCAIARKYAEDVLSGATPACKWVRLACQRQIDDLARKRGPAWPYHFDRKRAARICAFIELLPHVKGRWSKTIRLEPWQIFILATVFGWVDAKGWRRFRDVYIEVPRKNAKSTISSGVGLYMLAADDEPGADVFSAATKKDQARITWDDAKRMVGKTEGLRRRFGVSTFAHSIAVEETGSKFVSLSSDEDGLDGLNPHCGIVDELHAHKSRAVHDALESGTGSRKQSLMWRITTAGSNQAGVCYEQRELVIQILTRQTETEGSERYFGIIYTIDLPEKQEDGTVSAGDDWTDPLVWRKANPNYGVSVLPEDIATLASKAMASAKSQNNFLTKRLNVWVTAEEAYFNVAVWRRKCTRPVSLEDFEGETCWIGLDLSSKTDIASKVRIFKRTEKDRGKDGGEVEQLHLYVFGEHYLPEDVVETGVSTNCSHYDGWAREGYLTLTDGAAIDYGRIEDDLRDDCRRFSVRAIAYDPWNAEQLRQRLEKEGAPMVENRMGVQTMSEPMKTLDAEILSARIHSDGDPVLSWMLGNVVAKEDQKKNVYPRKEKPENKIDGAVALIMARRAAMLSKETPTDFGAFSL